MLIMRVFALTGLGAYVLGAVLGSTVFAQAPVPLPTLDPASKAKLDTVQRAASLANTSCQALEAVKVYSEIRSFVEADLTTSIPCLKAGTCAINWSTFTLMAKAPGK
jgi:hypothetical protein